MIKGIIKPNEVIDFIKKNISKGKAVALTGAGISFESGIPTFRGKGGLWEKYDPEVFAYVDSLVSIFKSQPERIVDFINDFYSLLLKARPNPAHLILSMMEKRGLLSSVITQNIDNLHQEAGSRSVIELHGNAYRIICRECLKNYLLEKDRLKEMVELLLRDRSSRIKLLKIFSRYFPRCNAEVSACRRDTLGKYSIRRCKGRFRLDIVLFGEMLPQGALTKAYEELDRCSLLFLIGTSGIIYPAAGLPLFAKERGAKIIEINSQDSVLSSICDYKIRGLAGEILPQIYNCL